MRKQLLRAVLIGLILLVPGAVFAVADGSASSEPAPSDVSPSDIPPYDTFPQALGGFYGPFSGSGIHYHRWFGDTGLHANFGVIYVPFGTDMWWDGGTTLDYSLGAEYQRRVYGEVFAPWLTGSLYVFAALRHRGYIPVILVAEGYYADPEDPNTWVDPVFELGTYQAELTVGAGIGVELILFRHLSLPVEFGYGANWTVTEPDLADAFAVGPNLQVGLRYRY